jgi:multidrug efflux pump
VRLRPILMTTAAMVLGVAPLLIASGAGAKARFSIGLVIAAGMAIGTLFTLFVLPMFYTFIASRDAPGKPVAIWTRRWRCRRNDVGPRAAV